MRITHFSSNPKLAEFLRNYEYVKEYGEGIDRMYRELDVVGLANPVFRLNAFMIQTIVYNAEGSKAMIMKQKSAFQEPNAKIGVKFLTGKETTDYVTARKIGIDTLKGRMVLKGYQQPTKEKLLRIYDVMEINRVFSVADVVKELSCPDSTARDVMKKLRELNVLVPVKGMWKGKY